MLLALLEDALLAWVVVGEVGVGDGWMATPAPCRTAASLPFMAGLKCCEIPGRTRCLL